MTLPPTPGEVRAAAPRANSRQHRIAVIGAWMTGVCTVVLALVFFRVVQLQTFPEKPLRDHRSERLTTLTEPGVRGEIRDIRGRPLAATTFARRVAVDPVNFPNPPHDALASLCEAIGISEADAAERLIPRMEKDLAIQRALARGESPEESLVRYVSLGPVLEDWRADRVAALDIPGVFLERRPVRRLIEPDLVGAIVGFVGIDNNGLLGAEHTLDKRLHGHAGHISYVRDARGNPMWVVPGGYTPADRGDDVRLSIDLELQRIAVEELRRGVEECDAAGGRLVMMNPRTGEILALVDLTRDLPDAIPFDWDHPTGPPGYVGKPRYITIQPDPRRDIHPAMGRNRCVEDIYEPGSTFKPFMWSVTTELGLADPDEVIDTEGGYYRTPYGRSLKDVVHRDEMTWAEVLINSSNIGMAKVTRRMTDPQMRQAVLRFGFGSQTGIALPGEAAGLVTSAAHWGKYTQTSVAMGHEIGVTPIQMVRAFCAFARDGENGQLAGTLPEARLVAVTAEESARLDREFAVRAIRPDIARLTRDTLRGVTHHLDERLLYKRGPDAEPFKYELFGKSGTAEIPLGAPPKGKRLPRGVKGYYPDQYNSSFICGGPAERPRLVLVVVIDDPGPERVATRTHYGSATAGPVVRRVMERALAYLGVPPSPQMLDADTLALLPE
jgi:cell division protein FtsI/penicillin-binding protein 2